MYYILTPFLEQIFHDNFFSLHNNAAVHGIFECIKAQNILYLKIILSQPSQRNIWFNKKSYHQSKTNCFNENCIIIAQHIIMNDFFLNACSARTVNCTCYPLNVTHICTRITMPSFFSEYTFIPIYYTHHDTICITTLRLLISLYTLFTVWFIDIKIWGLWPNLPDLNLLNFYWRPC